MPGATEGKTGFDFTFHARRLCADIAARLPELTHIDVERVAFRFCQARSPARHGTHATLTPLRFEQGALETARAGRRWTIERLYDGAGCEMLYLLSFYLPRFLNHSFPEKLATVFHELWHISPAFNGDLRRHPGRCYAHGDDGRAYDRQMNELARHWLALAPPKETYEFLQFDFAELKSRYGRVYGARIANPKLVPLGSQVADFNFATCRQASGPPPAPPA
ncbi:MAG TPA: hypothetical protein VGX78_00120 [Pirellulales bacterium]|jgi:predicted metallopeptidase|nr:hypothetical protein [Pirellulales bacterium]